MSNAMMVIFPYREQYTWVFDDERVGLVREPFVQGIPQMIDILVKDIPNAEKGFKLLFSGNPYIFNQVLKPSIPLPISPSPHQPKYTN